MSGDSKGLSTLVYWVGLRSAVTSNSSEEISYALVTSFAKKVKML